MEDKEYKDAMKKMYLAECVFNDVFSRFYHQLVNQGDVVIKDFFATPEILLASIVDGVVEAFMQRIEMTDSEQDKFVKNIYDKIFDGTTNEDFDKIDTFHDIKKTVGVLRQIVDIGMGLISDEQIKKSEDVKDTVLNKKSGDYQPLFMESDFPPAFVPREVKPVK